MTPTTALVVVCLSVLQSQAPASPKPADLAVVVRAAQDRSLPPAERDKLLGKEYVGSVTIRAVRLSPSGAATIEAETQPESDKPGVRVRFMTTGTDPVINTLSPDQVLRVRARLSGFSGSATAPGLSFTDMSIVTGG